MRGPFISGRRKKIESVLSKQGAAVFEYAYGVESGGNVPAHQDIRGEMSGKNVLYEAHSTDETAKKFGLTIEQTAVKLTAGRRALFEARAHRPQPPLDDKIVTAWNGMMISALARASQALDEPRYLERAQAKRISVIRRPVSFGAAIAQAVPVWTASSTTTPTSSAVFWITAEVDKNLSALSGVAYKKFGAIFPFLVAPNPAPKLVRSPSD